MLNEEADIAGAIEAVAAQDFGVDRIELILVDGCSIDATVLVAGEAAARHGFHHVHILRNPLRLTSISLNVGLREAMGTYLVRVDARSRIEPHYIRRCLMLLEQHANIGVVGGAQWARARDDRYLHVGIARALQNRWTTGLSRYRRTSRSGPSDTTWMGAFRTHDLRSMGGWDEAVALNEDYELAARYRAAGEIVWFEGSLRSEYLPRRGLSALALQYFRFGRVKGTWWARGRDLSPRHLLLLSVPPVVVAGIAVTASSQGWLLAATIVLVVLLVTDAFGGADTRARPLDRATAVLAMSLVTLSWWAGVVTGWSWERLSPVTART
jgi:glycosyltransferase involved in cell wall biosynthesis